MNNFGKYLKQIRKGRMTQRELAQRIGVGFPYISKIENNVEQPPSDEVLVKLSQALQVNSDEMFVHANKIPKDLQQAILQQPKLLHLIRVIKENKVDDCIIESFEKLIIQNKNMNWNSFNQSSQKMLLIDPDTSEIITANSAAIEFYNYPLEKFKTMKITEINTLSKEEVFEEMKRAKYELRNHFNFKHRLSTGEDTPVQVRRFPIVFGEKVYLQSIVQEAVESVDLIEEQWLS